MANQKSNIKKTPKNTKQSTKKSTKSTKQIAKNREKEYKSSILLLGIIIIGIIVLVFLFNKEEKWIQKGNTISKGSETYEIGDYYDYDETNNGEIANLTDVKWKVLGIDEDGNLLIMSASSVEELKLGDENSLEKSQSDYLEGSKKINDLTKKYGQGKGAISVRSFTNSDLTKLSNISTETEKNQYTYYWINETNPISINKDGEEYVSKLAHNSNFIWYDESAKLWKNSTKNGTETKENPVEITSTENTRLSFNNENFDTHEYRIKLDSKIFKMVYLNDSGEREKYWSDISHVYPSNSYIAYGLNVVLYDGLNYRTLVYSSGNTRGETAGIRAVVTID